MAAMVDGSSMALGPGQGPMGAMGQEQESKIQEYEKIIQFREGSFGRLSHDGRNPVCSKVDCAREFDAILPEPASGCFPPLILEKLVCSESRGYK